MSPGQNIYSIEAERVYYGPFCLGIHYRPRITHDEAAYMGQSSYYMVVVV